MTKLGLFVCALLSSLGAIGALEREKLSEGDAAQEIKQQTTAQHHKKNRAMGGPKTARKLQYGSGGYGGAAYARNGNGNGGGGFAVGRNGNGGGYGGYAYGNGNGNGNGNGGNGRYYSSSYRSKGMGMKGSSSKKGSYYSSSYGGNGGNGGNGGGGQYDDYYFMPSFDDQYYPGDDFLGFWGGPCVHVVEKIHFDFPPPTDIFAPNGGVFGDIGTMYIWALVTVKGFGTLDGVCIRTWPDVDGVGGDGLCNFVLTDPETGDQLLFAGKLDSITPGGALAVTGGSGSVSGVFGDMYVHVDVDGGDDVLDFAQDFYVDGLLGIIHCPQKFGGDEHGFY